MAELYTLEKEWGGRLRRLGDKGKVQKRGVAEAATWAAVGPGLRLTDPP